MAGIRNGGSSRFGSNPSTRRHPVPEPSLPGFSFGRVRQVPHRALVNRAARRLGHSASIPRAIMSRSPEALALGSRRHFIPASLSLPFFGCLLNRSRDCTRSRVPPLSRVGAMLTLLRLPLSLLPELRSGAFATSPRGRFSSEIGWKAVRPNFYRVRQTGTRHAQISFYSCPVR